MKIGKLTVGWNWTLAALLGMSTLAACCGDDDDDDDVCKLTCDADKVLDPASCTCKPKPDECTKTCEDNETLDEEACACVPAPCELLGCPDNETLNEADCVCEPTSTGDCSTPVSTEEAVGKAYVVDGNADTLSATCASPPTNPLICSQLPGLIGDSAFRIALYVDSLDGDTMTLIAGLLNNDNEQDGDAIEIPPVDFSGNPCFNAFLENFDISISDLTLTVNELTIEGSVAADLGQVDISVFRLVLDAQALSDLIGIDVCTLGLCQPDKTILLELHGITAENVPGVVIEL